MKKSILFLAISTLISGCDLELGGNDKPSTSSDYVGTIVNVNSDSMTVNSLLLDISNANIQLNDRYVHSEELEAGMVVDTEYNHQTNVAYEIDIEPEVLGIATSVSNTKIIVNGVVFAHSNLAEEFIGTTTNQVMLFGYPDQNGIWNINAIHEINGLISEELHEGKITSIDKASSTFYIETLKVDYSRIDYDDRFELKVGAWAELEGIYNVTMAVFDAFDVDIVNELDLAGKEVEGYVTELNENKSSMNLNGNTTVQITEKTIFEDGTKDDLVIGSKIDVDLVSSSRLLEAAIIEFD